MSAAAKEPTLITRPEDLRKLVDRLARQPIVAVDTESNSLFAYQERVCLMQFSTPEEDALVDPLALPDCAPLGPLFADPHIEKVFHAAEYDLICLKRDFDFTFANLFDTMVAARILGREEVGLGAMLAAEFKLEMDKRYQRANWGQRPLPADLLAYAQLDTRYLIPLRHRLRAQLDEKGLLPLALEDFQRICRVNGRNGEGRNGDCFRLNGAHDLPPQNAAVLNELCRYRDHLARSLDRPLFKVFNDRALVAIASACPRNLDELARLPGMTSRQVGRHGHALLAAVERGLNARPLRPPRSTRPSEAFLNRLESLRQWRKRTGERMGVKSDVILPRDLMFALAEGAPQNMETLRQAMGDVPWRFERFGAQILDALLHPPVAADGRRKGR
ncbi:MAG: HRDC domain-containing protein [Anaerolineales bacterium]|nr:HRDC domain-containing protein [Anaerolineales bacterium]